MKKILLALDYHPSATKIAKIGFELAKETNAELVLLHVIADELYYSTAVYDPIMGFAGYVNSTSLETDAYSKLLTVSQSFLDQTKLHLGDDAIVTMVVEGEPAASILETAKSIGADVIVMGTHSRNWLERIVMGSVTEKVLHLTPTPIFLIPTKQQEPSWK